MLGSDRAARFGSKNPSLNTTYRRYSGNEVRKEHIGGTAAPTGVARAGGGLGGECKLSGAPDAWELTHFLRGEGGGDFHQQTATSPLGKKGPRCHVRHLLSQSVVIIWENFLPVSKTGRKQKSSRLRARAGRIKGVKEGRQSKIRFSGVPVGTHLSGREKDESK